MNEDSHKQLPFWLNPLVERQEWTAIKLAIENVNPVSSNMLTGVETCEVTMNGGLTYAAARNLNDEKPKWRALPSSLRVPSDFPVERSRLEVKWNENLPEFPRKWVDFLEDCYAHFYRVLDARPEKPDWPFMWIESLHPENVRNVAIWCDITKVADDEDEEAVNKRALSVEEAEINNEVTFSFMKYLDEPWTPSICLAQTAPSPTRPPNVTDEEITRGVSPGAHVAWAHKLPMDAIEYYLRITKQIPDRWPLTSYLSLESEKHFVQDKSLWPDVRATLLELFDFLELILPDFKESGSDFYNAPKKLADFSPHHVDVFRSFDRRLRTLTHSEGLELLDK